MLLNSSLISSNVTSFPPASRHFACHHTADGCLSFRVPSLKLNCPQLVSGGSEHPLSLPTLPVASASPGQGTQVGICLAALCFPSDGCCPQAQEPGSGSGYPKICAHTQREKKTLFQRASSLQNEAKYYLLSASSA